MSVLQLFRNESESALQFYRRSENRSAAPFSVRSAERERAHKSKERLMLCPHLIILSVHGMEKDFPRSFE